MSKKVIVIALFCFLVLFNLIGCGHKPEQDIYGNGYGKICGVVTDKESGEPLVSVSLYLVGTTFGAATNEIGEYYIFGVPAGKYTIRVAYIGYKSFEARNIKVYAHKQTIKDFVLKPEVIELRNIKLK